MNVNNETKICPVCKKTIESERHNKKYCSVKCRTYHYYHTSPKYKQWIEDFKEKNRKHFEPRKCSVCLKTFTPRTSKHFLCSRKCYNIHQRAHASPDARQRTIAKTIIKYFISKYCELGDYFMDLSFFCDCLNQIANKYHVKFNTLTHENMQLLSYTLKKAFNIIKKNRSGKRTAIEGVRLNPKGIDTFNIQNIANIKFKQSIPTRKEVCIATSCEPGQHEFLTQYEQFNDDLKAKIDPDKTITTYKEIESQLFKLGKQRSKYIKIALATHLTNKQISQIEAAELFNTTAVSIRALSKLIDMKKSSWV